MQTQPKPIAINSRHVTLALLALAARGFAVGLAVSLAAALLIAGFVTLAS